MGGGGSADSYPRSVLLLVSGAVHLLLLPCRDCAHLRVDFVGRVVGGYAASAVIGDTCDHVPFLVLPPLEVGGSLGWGREGGVAVGFGTAAAADRGDGGRDVAAEGGGWGWVGEVDIKRLGIDAEDWRVRIF